MYKMGSPKVDVKLFVRQPFQCFSLSPTPTCFASLHAYAWNVYTMNFPSVVFLSHMEMNISSKRWSSSFTIAFTFWRLHPQKYPPAPKNKTLLTMMKRMQSGAWKRCSIYRPKKSVQLLENGWHLSSLEKPVGIHLKKDATLRDIYPFWFIFILVKSQSLWLKSPFLLILSENGMPPK